MEAGGGRSLLEVSTKGPDTPVPVTGLAWGESDGGLEKPEGRRAPTSAERRAKT